MRDIIDDMESPVPPKVRTYMTEICNSAAVRDSPPAEHFVGREPELASLNRTVNRTIQATNHQLKPAGQVWIAAPGAGKSSLFRELGRQLTARKVRVIHTKPQNIATPKLLSNTLRKHLPWWSAKKIKAFLHKHKENAAAVTDGILTAGGLAYLKSYGIEVPITHVDMVQIAIEKIGSGETPTTEESLALLVNATRGKGCVLCIDEGQSLEQYADENPEHWDELLGTLGLPDSRQDAGLHQVTVLITGLSDTPQIVENACSPGFEPFALGPLPEEQVKIMIENAISRGLANQPPYTRERLTRTAQRRFADRMTAEFADWTRHAQAACEAVTPLLEKFGEEMVHGPWGAKAAIDLGNEIKANVYRKVLNQARRYADDRVVDIAMLSLLCNNNRLNKSRMRSIVNSTLHTFSQDLNLETNAEFNDAIETNLQGLIHSGALDVTDFLPNPDDQNWNAYYCPIPSLLSHANETKSPYEDDLQAILTRTFPSSHTPTPIADHFRPNWSRTADNNSQETK